jgi:hypothetical protein
MTTVLAITTLAEHADAIRELSKRIVTDVIEIGRRLTVCRDILKEDNSWRAWLSDLRVSPQTAGRFIQVYELSGDVPKLERLDLPVSALYLLAAPSTPEVAKTEIIARAQAGEAVPVAEVKRVVKRHRSPSSKRKQRDGASIRIPSCAEVARRTKLGDATVNRLRGTSLSSAKEMDGLLELNFGAPDGAHTEIVKKLIADALAGKKVSAVELADSAPLTPASTAGQTDISVIERQAAHVQKLKDENDQLKSRIFELESELEKSRAEVAALRTELHGKVGARAASAVGRTEGAP